MSQLHIAFEQRVQRTSCTSWTERERSFCRSALELVYYELGASAGLHSPFHRQSVDAERATKTAIQADPAWAVLRGLDAFVANRERHAMDTDAFVAWLSSPDPADGAQAYGDARFDMVPAARARAAQARRDRAEYQAVHDKVSRYGLPAELDSKVLEPLPVVGPWPPTDLDELGDWPAGFSRRNA